MKAWTLISRFAFLLCYRSIRQLTAWMKAQINSLLHGLMKIVSLTAKGKSMLTLSML